jgi:hypothetical protein
MERNAWTGWIVFAGWLMVIIGVIDFIEGLIAVIRKQYYVLAPNQVIVFDVKTWGWVTLIWGIVLVLAGLAAPGRRGSVRSGSPGRVPLERAFHPAWGGSGRSLGAALPREQERQRGAGAHGAAGVGLQIGAERAGIDDRVAPVVE